MNRDYLTDVEFMDVELEDFGELMDTKFPSPEMLEFYRRLQKREIIWNDDVTVDMISVAMYIQGWNREDLGRAPGEREPIHIYINTDGGDLNTVMAVIDVIGLSKTPVWTIGLGKCYSAGGMLLMAGHRRLILPNTNCLIHDGSSGMIGDTGKLLDNLKFTERLEERTRSFILEHTKIPPKTLDQNYRKDWFLIGQELIEYGIADEILTDIDLL